MGREHTMLRRFGPFLLAVLGLTLVACTDTSEGVATTSDQSSLSDDQAGGGETLDDGTSSYDEPEPGIAPPATEAGPATPMQTSVEVTELLEAWRESGPRDYEYNGDLFVLSMPEDDPTAECGSRGGPIAVWVADGEPIEGQFPESACVVDLGSPTRPPLTAEELFERTLVVMDDFDAARIEVNEVGFPTSIFTESRVGVIEFSVRSFTEGVGQPGTATDEAARLGRARARWDQARPDSYLIEVERTCRCAPPYRGPFEVLVDGGVVTATVDGAAVPDDISADSFTVDGLFDAIEAWSDADRLLVIYDADRGIPLRIDVDPVAGTADDEVTLTTTRFVFDGRIEGQDASAFDLEMLLRDLESDADNAPDDVRTVGDATFCGFDDVSLNSEPIGGDPISRACFTSRAARGDAAVHVRRSPTAEGDPIITVFKVAADGLITVHNDSSQDSYGSGGWTTASCGQIEMRPEIGTNFFTVRC